MYKKKLGVRVITAITVGALLSSNMSVAMANTRIAQIEDDLNQEEEESEEPEEKNDNEEKSESEP